MYYDEVYVQQQQMEIYAVQSQQRNITAVVDWSAVNCRQHIYFTTTTVCNRTSITAVLTQCRDFS